MRAPVAELFSSVQGEGPYVGVRQVFVRTYGCDLRCTYCDTPASRSETGPCRIENEPGSGSWTEVANPIDSELILTFIRSLGRSLSAHHGLAITGGEPLLHPQFVTELAHGARALGLKVYLETNGQRAEELEQVISAVDIVAMDAKLPSSQQAGSDVDPNTFIERTVQFLKIARQREVFVKVICEADTQDAEVEHIAATIATETADLTLILQPATPLYRGQDALGAVRLLRLQEIAAKYLHDVRIIPQCHRLMGMR